MSKPLPPELLSRLSKLVAEHLGLYFPPGRWSDLERGIRSVAGEFEFKEPESCVEWLASAPLSRQQVEILAGHLTVGETYFYRERAAFAALEEHVLPQLSADCPHAQRRLRIWCAACCTGEEAYSLAIAAKRSIPWSEHWEISVLATDINPHFLEKAALGVYGDWSFRDTPPVIRQRYFRPTADGRYEILPEIRKLVRFDYLNLAEDPYPSLLNQTNGLDLIFCRNVMIYFDPVLSKRVALKLGHCLSDNGWLFVGAAETSSLLFGELQHVNFNGAIVYRKCAGALKRGPVPAASLPGASESTLAPARRSQGPRAAPEPYRKKPASAPEKPTALAAAAAFFDQGRYADVLEALKGPAAIGQPAAVLLSRAHANRGELPEALAHCERALVTGKLSAPLQYLRGTILAESGQPDEASVAFRRATYLDADFVMAHFALGHLARGRGNAAEASRHFNRVARLLRKLPADEPLPESDGVTAARLAEVIAMLQS